MYTKLSTNKGTLLVCLHEDDLIVIGSNENVISSLKLPMLKGFEMTDLGQLSYVMRIIFKRTKEGIVMH